MSFIITCTESRFPCAENLNITHISSSFFPTHPVGGTGLHHFLVIAFLQAASKMSLNINPLLTHFQSYCWRGRYIPAQNWWTHSLPGKLWYYFDLCQLLLLTWRWPLPSRICSVGVQVQSLHLLLYHIHRLLVVVGVSAGIGQHLQAARRAQLIQQETAIITTEVPYEPDIDDKCQRLCLQRLTDRGNLVFQVAEKVHTMKSLIL